MRPPTNGAAAISAQPSIGPMIAAHSSVRRASACAMLGTIENASHDTEVMKNPVEEDEVEALPFDAEARGAEECDESAREHEARRQDELQLGQRIRVPEGRIGQEKGKRGPEQAEEQHLSPEEAFEAIVVHRRFYRQNQAIP